MAEVVAFKPKEPDDPNIAGAAACIACQHRWTSVAPIGTVWLTCPYCGAQKGLMTFPCERAGSHWRCPCGNELFNVMPEGIYCPNCGAWQEGF